jgi:hypothetical protein
MVDREVCAVMRKGENGECNATQSTLEKEGNVFIVFQLYIDLDFG